MVNNLVGSCSHVANRGEIYTEGKYTGDRILVELEGNWYHR